MSSVESKSQRGKAEMVCTCAEEEQWIYWIKDVEYGTARHGKKRKTSEKSNLKISLKTFLFDKNYR